MGLSTFNDGRGIFDWNADEDVPAVFNVGGGDGDTTTDGDMPRRIVPVRVL